MGLVEAGAIAFRGIWEELSTAWREWAGRNASPTLTSRPGMLPVVEPDGDVVQVPYAALRHNDLVDEAGEVRAELF